MTRSQAVEEIVQGCGMLDRKAVVNAAYWLCERLGGIDSTHLYNVGVYVMVRLLKVGVMAGEASIVAASRAVHAINYESTLNVWETWQQNGVEYLIRAGMPEDQAVMMVHLLSEQCGQDPHTFNVAIFTMDTWIRAGLWTSTSYVGAAAYARTVVEYENEVRLA